jgi:CRP-like cAMP-binding protein
VLSQQVEESRFPAGETIFHAGEPGAHAYIVCSGQVHITLTDLAEDLVLVDVVGHGGLAGMSSLLAKAEHMTTAVAVYPPESFLSMLAAIQAPVIMMSQNRQDTKDRVRRSTIA